MCQIQMNFCVNIKFVTFSFFLNTHVESHQNLNICFHVYRWGAFEGLLQSSDLHWSNKLILYLTCLFDSQWSCLVLHISPLWKSFLLWSVKLILGPPMLVLYPAWTADIYNGPASMLFFLLSVLTVWKMLPDFVLTKASCVSLQGGVRPRSPAVIWRGRNLRTPGPEGTSCLTSREQRHFFLVLLTGCCLGSPFGLVLESASKCDNDGTVTTLSSSRNEGEASWEGGLLKAGCSSLSENLNGGLLQWKHRGVHL